jgi:hypothetical protein
MLRRLFISISLIFGTGFLACAQDTLDLATPEGFGKQVLIAFQSNNFPLFDSLMFNEKKYDEVLSKVQAADSVRAEYRKSAIGAISNLHHNAKSNFSVIIDKGTEMKIRWDSVEFVKVDFTARNKADYECGDIAVFAKYSSINFLIVLPGCIKSKVWNITNEVSIYFN